MRPYNLCSLCKSFIRIICKANTQISWCSKTIWLQCPLNPPPLACDERTLHYNEHLVTAHCRVGHLISAVELQSHQRILYSLTDLCGECRCLVNGESNKRNMMETNHHHHRRGSNEPLTCLTPSTTYKHVYGELLQESHWACLIVCYALE